MKYSSTLRRLLPLAALTLVGALAGYLYYRLVGCVTGTCPIASRPLVSTVYGAVIGALLGFALTPRRKDPPGDA